MMPPANLVATGRHRNGVAKTAVPPSGSVMATTTSEAAPVGPYRDFVLHASGGLGEVLRATDIDLHRVVAVKRLQDKYAGDASNQRRFRLEAEITARLEHP